MKLIGLTGPAGCGKDTVALYLSRKYGYATLSFAHPIKAALNIMFGWGMPQWDDREWKERPIPWLGVSPRKLAQTLGTDWGRDMIHPRLWLLLAHHTIQRHIQDGPYSANPRDLVISDVRFENEAVMIRASGGAVWHIERPGIAPVEGHVSEAGIAKRPGDVTVLNDRDFAALYFTIDQCVARTKVMPENQEIPESPAA